MFIELDVYKISEDNFSDFGVYVGKPAGSPSFSDTAFSWWDGLAEAEIGSNAAFGLVQPKYQEEITQQIFEQHKNTAEVLIPLDHDIVITVGKAEAFTHMFKKDDFAAFLVPKGTAVILDKGVWHYAPAALSNTANVLVIFKSGTSENDKIVKSIDPYSIKVKFS